MTKEPTEAQVWHSRYMAAQVQIDQQRETALQLLGQVGQLSDENERLREALADVGCDHCRHWFDRAALEGK